MPRILAVLAGAVLLLAAGLLVLNARESEESARAVTSACAHAARLAAEPARALGLQPLPSISHCTYARRWDMSQVALAGFALAGSLGFFIFALTRRQGQA